MLSDEFINNEIYMMSHNNYPIIRSYTYRGRIWKEGENKHKIICILEVSFVQIHPEIAERLRCIDIKERREGPKFYSTHFEKGDRKSLDWNYYNN